MKTISPKLVLIGEEDEDLVIVIISHSAVFTLLLLLCDQHVKGLSCPLEGVLKLLLGLLELLLRDHVASVL